MGDRAPVRTFLQGSITVVTCRQAGCCGSAGPGTGPGHGPCLQLPLERHDLRMRRQQFQAAGDQRRVRAAPGQQLAIEAQHRLWIAFLLVHGQFAVFIGHRQPGLARLRKTGVGATLFPRKGRAAAVAPLEFRPHANAIGVTQLVEGQVGLGQAQLVALIDARGATQGHLQGGGQADQPVVRPGGFSPPGPHPLHIVVRNGPRRPAVLHDAPELRKHAVQVPGRVVFVEQVEAVGHVQPVAAAGVFGNHLQGMVVTHFAHQRGVGVAVQQPAHALQERDVLRLGLVVDVFLPAVRVDDAQPRVVLLVAADGRVVLQRRVVEVVVHRIQPKAIHTQLQPETHVGQQRVLHLPVVKVQVRLAGQEIVQVILHPPGVPAPGTAAEYRLPVVWWRTVRFGIGPHIPVGFRVFPALAAFHEPRVFFGRVRQHLVDDDLQPQFVRTCHQRPKIVQGAEHRVHVAVVRHVVAEVVHRAFEEGREPDAVHAQLRHIVQPLGDAVQVADAVAGGVLIAARVDLVDDTATPPFIVGRTVCRRIRAARYRCSGLWRCGGRGRGAGHWCRVRDSGGIRGRWRGLVGYGFAHHCSPFRRDRSSFSFFAASSPRVWPFSTSWAASQMLALTAL